MATFDDTLGCEPVLDFIASYCGARELGRLSACSRYLRWALTLSELGERHWGRLYLPGRMQDPTCGIGWAGSGLSLMKSGPILAVGELLAC